jgi:hypothetical protein
VGWGEILSFNLPTPPNHYYFKKYVESSYSLFLDAFIDCSTLTPSQNELNRCLCVLVLFTSSEDYVAPVKLILPTTSPSPPTIILKYFKLSYSSHIFIYGH